ESLDHYRVLEVVPKASAKEVQSAYQLLKKTYDPETTCLSSLMDAPGLRELQGRIEAAYRTLIFLESRSDYDRQLLGTGALKEDQGPGLHAGRVTAAAAPPPTHPGTLPGPESEGGTGLELAGGQAVPPAPVSEPAPDPGPAAAPGPPEPAAAAVG